MQKGLFFSRGKNKETKKKAIEHKQEAAADECNEERLVTEGTSTQKEGSFRRRCTCKDRKGENSFEQVNGSE